MSNSQYSSLYLSTELSDVTLIIDNTKLPAHRSILSDRSEYFKTMFSNDFIEAKANEIELKQTNLDAFKVVLNYIYTGNIKILYNHSYSQLEIFEILTCAQYYLIDTSVTQKIILYLKHTCTPPLLLNNALVYHIDELILYSTCLIQKEATDMLKQKIFEQLSPLAVEHVLKVCLNAHESIIFEALVNWMRANAEYSYLFPKFLKYVDLFLLDDKQLDILFAPVKLIHRSFFRKLLRQQRNRQKNVLKIVNQNVINDINNIRIIEGSIRCFPDCGLAYLTFYPKQFCIVDLKKQYLLNCFKLEIKYGASYKVCVSNNLHEWKCVTDHLEFSCFGLQVLHFNEHIVRFIRIECRNSVHICFNTNANIEAVYLTDPWEFDSMTTLTIPKHNVVLSELTTIVKEGSTGVFINGSLVDDYIRHVIGTGCIIYQFSQPYIVNSIKLLLKEKSSYYVEVKSNENWTRVFTEENAVGWRTATFLKEPVMFIKIVGTLATSKFFNLYGLKCPAS